MRVSIVIPTFDGLALLQKHLPALLAAEGAADAELVIADDASTDGTLEWLAEHVTQARVVCLAENGGFSRACNAGIAASKGDIIVLLNNDVEVTSGFLAPLIEPIIRDPNVFAVNASILIPGKEMLDEGEKRGSFHHGIFYVNCLHDPARRATSLAPTLYATACAAAYRRTMLETLGGFDVLFSPAYWEDVDLSYRARKRGWAVLFEPKSVVYHQHEATTSRLSARTLATLRARNGFIFVWKNITDARWTLASILCSPLVGLYRVLRDRDSALLRGLWAAVRLIPAIFTRRAAERRAACLSDREVLQSQS